MSVRLLAAHEARALLPTWTAAAASATAAALSRGDVHHVSEFAFAAATVALGGQIVGHDYSDRTLALTLTLPIDRRRLFLVKLAVTAALVLPLAVYATLLGLFAELAISAWLVAAIAICLGPTLTMLCRSHLAGTVFSLSLPWVVLIVAMLGTGTLDSEWEVRRAAFDIWSRLMTVLLAGGAALGWWLFVRLEAIEGGGLGFHAASRLRTTHDAVPRHPVWQLVRKELRLQQMTFAVTALCLGACAAAVALGVPGPARDVSFSKAAALIYALGLPTVIGALAIAEERQLGTLSWQQLLPAPAWQQWMAKIGTVFTLTLALSIGVPLLLVPALRPNDWLLLQTLALLAVVMTAASLYVSSLCANAVRAVVISVAAVSFALWLVVEPEIWTGQSGGSVALLSIVVGLLVRFAYLNHRPEPPAAASIWRQTAALAALIGVGSYFLGLHAK